MSQVEMAETYTTTIASHVDYAGGRRAQVMYLARAGMTYRQIADALGIRLNNVHQVVFHAREAGVAMPEMPRSGRQDGVCGSQIAARLIAQGADYDAVVRASGLRRSSVRAIACRVRAGRRKPLRPSEARP